MVVDYVVISTIMAVDVLLDSDVFIVLNTIDAVVALDA